MLRRHDRRHRRAGRFDLQHGSRQPLRDLFGHEHGHAVRVGRGGAGLGRRSQRHGRRSPQRHPQRRRSASPRFAEKSPPAASSTPTTPSSCSTLSRRTGPVDRIACRLAGLRRHRRRRHADRPRNRRLRRHGDQRLLLSSTPTTTDNTTPRIRCSARRRRSPAARPRSRSTPARWAPGSHRILRQGTGQRGRLEFLRLDDAHRAAGRRLRQQCRHGHGGRRPEFDGGHDRRQRRRRLVQVPGRRGQVLRLQRPTRHAARLRACISTTPTAPSNWRSTTTMDRAAPRRSPGPRPAAASTTSRSAAMATRCRNVHAERCRRRTPLRCWPHRQPDAAVFRDDARHPLACHRRRRRQPDLLGSGDDDRPAGPEGIHARPATRSCTRTPNGSYYTNARGAGEKYMLGNGNVLYFILPNGALYRWGGSIAKSTLVDTLSPAYYANPALLHSGPSALAHVDQQRQRRRDRRRRHADRHAGRRASPAFCAFKSRVSDGAKSDSETFTVADPFAQKAYNLDQQLGLHTYAERELLRERPRGRREVHAGQQQRAVLHSARTARSTAGAAASPGARWSPR